MAREQLEMKVSTNGQIKRLTRAELDELIESETQERLGLSRREFEKRLEKGNLAPHPAVADISQLLKLGE